MWGDSNFLVSSLFKLLNFAVFIFFAWYVFHRFVRGLIVAEIRKYRLSGDKLNSKIVDLNSELSRLESSAQEQKDTCSRLLRNVKCWRKVSGERAEKLEEEHRKNLEAVAERAALRAKREKASKLGFKAVDEAVKEATEKLSKKYSSEIEGPEFLARALENMRKTR